MTGSFNLQDLDRYCTECGAVALDCSRLAATVAARVAFGLPYFWAGMRIERDRDQVRYVSRRRWPSPRGAGGYIAV
ncbi:hypothetical protein GIS00_26475 [Nakamurella sp. YIM 132087]|uniref:Uncharacterized protein n=1 Tax=Nakamurella alba TaxID=2665158 RepID=A0A7K1FTN4_9ACTN|nr:hypothetical protein [Nakamurella alba]